MIAGIYAVRERVYDPNICLIVREDIRLEGVSLLEKRKGGYSKRRRKEGRVLFTEKSVGKVG